MEPHVSTETPPPATSDTELVVEAKQEVDNKITVCAESTTADTVDQSLLIEDQHSPTPPPSAIAPTTAPAELVNKDAFVKPSDTVDAPVGSLPSSSPPPSLSLVVEPLASAEKVLEEKRTTEEVTRIEKEQPVAPSNPELALEAAVVVAPVQEEKDEVVTKSVTETPQPPSSAQEPAAPQTGKAEPEPTLDKTEEPPLPNGLPQDVEELSEDVAISDTTTADKPDTTQSQESTSVDETAAPSEEEEMVEKKEDRKEKSEDALVTSVNCPAEESSMQGRLKQNVNTVSQIV